MTQPPWTSVSDRIKTLVDFYVPERHHNLRRHFYQDLASIFTQVGHDAEAYHKFRTMNRPLWKRVWFAILRRY